MPPKRIRDYEGERRLKEAKENCQKHWKKARSQAKEVLGLRKTPKLCHIPGPSCAFPEIELELANLIAQNKECPLLRAQLSSPSSAGQSCGSAAASSGYFFWDTQSIIMSLQLRVERDHPGKGYYAFEHASKYVSRFLRRHPQIKVLTPNKIARFGGMNHEELMDRIHGTLIDFYRLQHAMGGLSDGLLLGFLDETSLLLDPPPCARLFGTGRPSEVAFPAKGTWRMVTYMSVTTNCQTFQPPVCLILGKAVAEYERRLVCDKYGVGLNYSKQPGVWTPDFFGRILIAFSGNSSGGSHMDICLFHRWLEVYVARFNQWKARVGKPLAKSILLMDGASCHGTDSWLRYCRGRESRQEKKGKQPYQNIGGKSYDEFLNENGIFICRLRSNLTSFLCLQDALLFAPLKRAVRDCWREGVPSILTDRVKRHLLDVPFSAEICCQGSFSKFGFGCGQVVPFEQLQGRLRALIPRALYVDRMRSENIQRIFPPLRARQRGHAHSRLCQSETYDHDLAWQRPRPLLSRKGKKEMILNRYRKLYGTHIAASASDGDGCGSEEDESDFC